jgi:hypothetical protein
MNKLINKRIKEQGDEIKERKTGESNILFSKNCRK